MVCSQEYLKLHLPYKFLAVAHISIFASVNKSPRLTGSGGCRYFELGKRLALRRPIVAAPVNRLTVNVNAKSSDNGAFRESNYTVSSERMGRSYGSILHCVRLYRIVIVIVCLFYHCHSHVKKFLSRLRTALEKFFEELSKKTKRYRGRMGTFYYTSFIFTSIIHFRLSFFELLLLESVSES